MSSHLREISEDSVASQDTELTTDARLAKATEEMLAVTEALTKDEDILRQTLSVRSIVSASRFAERMRRAKSLQDSTLVVIGRGTCGTIFEIPGTESAYKKGRDKDSLWNDANLTNKACRAVTETKTCLQETFPNTSIPRWRENLSQFPNDTEIGYLFQVQRIFPLPKPSREALIRLYFPKKMHHSAYEDPDNKACLVRPYLGQRRGEWEFSRPALSLHNFPLYLDQIEELQLEAVQYSEGMAIGLVIIHWKAHLDGMDMEFVLGSATTHGELPTVVENFKTDTFERAHLLAASNLLLTQKGMPNKAIEYPALFLKAWKKRATELAKDTEGGFVEFG
ncbi:hypothetical protein N7449_008770 [Penicillium cf. viridicatum]|uniref:DUF3669 domain-containing protein n=1 Tax=Penicillium cf. viridicatum TaxID=2972119 RepID=A0A9W9J8V9_9EURO|nr:hypothetical protein N7449_008770 [Penicillium cf. viridicatum]